MAGSSSPKAGGSLNSNWTAADARPPDWRRPGRLDEGRGENTGGGPTPAGAAGAVGAVGAESRSTWTTALPSRCRARGRARRRSITDRDENLAPCQRPEQPDRFQPEGAAP